MCIRDRVLSTYYKNKPTTWGSCVAEVAIAFEAFPVIVWDADSLPPQGKLFNAQALCFYTQ